MLLKAYLGLSVNSRNVCPVGSIAVLFIKTLFVSLIQVKITNKTHSHQSLPH